MNKLISISMKILLNCFQIRGGILPRLAKGLLYVCFEKYYCRTIFSDPSSFQIDTKSTRFVKLFVSVDQGTITVGSFEVSKYIFSSSKTG